MAKVIVTVAWRQICLEIACIRLGGKPLLAGGLDRFRLFSGANDEPSRVAP